MAFQIKDFVSISASMTNWAKATTKKVTDFSIGSVFRTLVEAVAIELDELYQQMFIGLKEAIPVAVYNSFDFGLLAAIPASGLIRVTVTSSVGATTISGGTAFSLINGAVYKSSNDVIIAPGATYVDVTVSSSTSGVAGNLSAGQSFTVTPAINTLVSATNPSAFLNGADGEEEEARKLRFNQYIQSLSRGTVAALQYGLEKQTFLQDAAGNITERVGSASVIEPWVTDVLQPVSLVNCYIHNGVGGTSGGLVIQARKVLYGYVDENGVSVPGWKAAGVRVEVYAAADVAVAVTGVLTAELGYDKPTLLVAATEEIYTYLQELPIGASAIKSEMVRLVKQIAGVYNIVLSAPAADTTANQQTKLMPGVIAIS